MEGIRVLCASCAVLCMAGVVSQARGTITEHHTEASDYRKYYGLNFLVQCPDYKKSFKCLRVCKSLAYDISRLDYSCKCTCHQLPTTTLIPFFKWKTTGTTAALPKTRSVGLWDVAGTLFTTKNETDEDTTTVGYNENISTTMNYGNTGTDTSGTGGTDANRTETSDASESTTAAEAQIE